MKILIYGGRGWIGSQFIDIIRADDGLCEHVCGIARVDDPTHFYWKSHNITRLTSFPLLGEPTVKSATKSMEQSIIWNRMANSWKTSVTISSRRCSWQIYAESPGFITHIWVLVVFSNTTMSRADSPKVRNPIFSAHPIRL